MAEKVVLAYSGGLDTSVAIRWIGEKYHLDVITLTVEIGGEKDMPAIQQKALNVGAVKALVVDARELFVKQFVFPALQADAIYEGQYPLASALGRPLIAKLLVDAATEQGALAVAHGCTGKGNDQVRFDVSVMALAPQLRIVAPAREWGMTREETILYAQRHGIPVPVTVASPYSIDENLWGRSIECGVLEDPWAEPPEEVFAWTKSPKDALDEPSYVEIGFEGGIPISLDGRELDGVALIQELNEIAGEHGVGRIDHVENRLVGIKSREVYEAPAATVLLVAHKALEAMTLSRDQLRFKEKVAAEYADLIYNGLWFTALHQDLAAYVQSTQRHVTGTVRIKLHKGNATVVGRKSPKSLYSYGLATYDKGDIFDQSAAPGFIHIWGLPVKTQAQVQGVEGMEKGGEVMSLRSFEEVWQHIQKLKGETVYTLDRKLPNDIVDFTPNGMLRISHAPQATGDIKAVSKRAFQKVWENLVKEGHFEAKYGWKIVFACIAHLPEVEYSLNPETLWLSEKTHPFCKQVKREA